MSKAAGNLDIGKLKQLLAYLQDHNHHHVEDLEQWAERIEVAGHGEVAAEIRKAVELYNRMGDHFSAANEKL